MTDLQRYGVHKANCTASYPGVEICDCGFTAAIEQEQLQFHADAEERQELFRERDRARELLANTEQVAEQRRVKLEAAEAALKRARVQDLVREFHVKFGQHAGHAYREMPASESEFRAGFLLEEVLEFAEAHEAGDVPKMVDALVDIIYVAYGTALCMGLDLEPFVIEVHAANMRKEGGGVRADNKILKPPGWVGPNHEPLLKAQGWKPEGDNATGK